MNRSERRRAAKAARKQGRRATIEAAPEPVQETFQHALDLYGRGRLNQAENLLVAIDESSPGISNVAQLRGIIALHTGRPDRAASLLERAVAADPRNAALHQILGIAYHGLGRIEDGIVAFRKASALDPGNHEAPYAMGNMLREAGRLAEAVACYEAALRIEPDFVDARYNLGLAYSGLERWDAALAAYEAVLAQSPDAADVHIGLSKVLAMLRRCEAAERHARAALAITPDAIEAHSNLSRALQGLGRIEEAVAAMNEALALAPDNPDLHLNTGVILEDWGEIDAAEAAFRRAIELNPGFAEAHSNLGGLLLRHGRYEEGWREYDWRFRHPGFTPRPFPQPRWDGAELAGKTVLAWADEGAGDEIQLASLLPELIARAGRCLVECDERLVPAFERSFARAEIHGRRDRPAKKLLADAIDFQTPFSELPRWLRPDLAAAPKPGKPYLRADEALTAACRARYRGRGDGIVVGIAWSSGNLHRPGRNAPLALWEPILTQPGVQFVSLQYGDHAIELAETREKFGVDIFVDPEVDQLKSLERFAAQVAAVDLVISITNTTVHMAGALGRPVWTMLPHVAHWRYRQATEDTMWYPHMRLFRQAEPWRWDDVMERVGGELAAFRAAAN